MLSIADVDKRIIDIEEIKRICNLNNSHLMILGVGVYAEALSDYFKTNGLTVQIDYVIDDQYLSEQLKERGIIPISKYLSDFAKTSPLVFGFYNYEIILKKKEELKDLVPYMFDFHMTVIGDVKVDWNYDFVTEHIEEFNKTYEMLSSQKSKDTMQGYINAAVAGYFDEFYKKYKDEIPYFNSKLTSMKIDRLFDCGAFDGDSAHDFVAVFDDYEKIFEFEPDPTNVEKIKARVQNESIRDLTIVQKGVWSETTTLRFASEGKSSSNVSDKGDIAIDVIKIDDMYDEFTHNSLIKMDIEGSEMAALSGAARVIREISPALAICVYHKRDDLITIPQYIDSLVETDTYDYFVGYQGLDLAELVFYAVPKNR